MTNLAWLVQTSRAFINIMKHSPFILLSIIISALFFGCGSDKGHVDTPEWPDPDNEDTSDVVTASKPFYIWVDASANFPDYANSESNIERDLKLTKDAGFTDVVVDVRPVCGEVLFNSEIAQKVTWLGAWTSNGYEKIERTATFDYLQAFIDAGHKLGLRIHAGFNTFSGGYKTSLGTMGPLYTDSDKREWATYLSTKEFGIVNALDYSGSTQKFMNPVNEEVQDYIISLLKELAAYDLDGIILDRCRFDNLNSDFSDLTRTKFQAYLGNVTIPNWPDDVLTPGATSLPSTYPTYLKKWLEFRVKTIHDFVEKARSEVKAINPDIKFGVYVGGWYSSYYTVGVNWASPNYNTSADYEWATADYKKYGYADHCDHILIGAYASPTNVYGNGEWTMEGFCKQAKAKIGTSCPIVAGGPDIGNWDPNDEVSQSDENQAVVNSVKACYDACDGYFLFDIIDLKKFNQWEYVAEGIKIAKGEQ